MSGRYVRQVKPGEKWDPTMTGVEDVSVFHPGDYLHIQRGYKLIMHIEQIDNRTRFLDYIDMDTCRPGATLHDLRENDVLNAYYNSIMVDSGKAPADVMGLDEYKARFTD